MDFVENHKTTTFTPEICTRNKRVIHKVVNWVIWKKWLALIRQLNGSDGNS